MTLAKGLNAVGLMLGYISLLWLLFALTCFPLTSLAKTLLVGVVLFATVFSSASFVFFANDLCREYGCVLSVGGYLAIASVIGFFLTTLSLLPVKSKRRHRSPKSRNRKRPKCISCGSEEEKCP